MTSRVSVREAKLEDYFVEQVEKHGGRADKFVSPGRRGVPDRLVTWPRNGWAKLDLVELKTVGGKLAPWQERDHAERKKLGCIVRTLWTKAQIDEYIRYEVNRRCPPGPHEGAHGRTL